MAEPPIGWNFEKAKRVTCSNL